jgi:hypothetical protein
MLRRIDVKLDTKFDEISAVLRSQAERLSAIELRLSNQSNPHSGQEANETSESESKDHLATIAL